MRNLCVTFILALSLTSPAWAAEPFDGKWSGDSPPAAGCSSGARVIFEVRNGEIAGSATSGTLTVPIGGHVAPDGTASITSSIGGFPAKFSGNSFEWNYTFRGCDRHYKGSRSS